MFKSEQLKFIFSFLFLIHFIHAQNRNIDVKLNFLPVFENKPLVLNEQRYLANEDSVTITKLRFYISNITLIFNDGSKFQQKELCKLIDADSLSNQIVLQNIPDKKIDSINFFIGLDSATNVGGALSGDLDPMHGMYWSWNSGYINAKLEGISKSCSTHKNVFEFHIGGYLQPNYTLRTVTLQNGNAEQNEFEIYTDASAWFSNISLSKTNNVVIPGNAAMKIADNYCKMFRLK